MAEIHNGKPLRVKSPVKQFRVFEQPRVVSPELPKQHFIAPTQFQSTQRRNVSSAISKYIDAVAQQQYFAQLQHIQPLSPTLKSRKANDRKSQIKLLTNQILIENEVIFKRQQLYSVKKPLVQRCASPANRFRGINREIEPVIQNSELKIVSQNQLKQLDLEFQ
ncbi:Hypothetical_protein [Hexamita inflata]|uniref:Hypothetical_protein n=1 Tax=Hexamita inflata TaxID=28002 RepID=A0AA86TX63_9EUKA|nr:Hypothetical protein HINF_LOCUS18002 [Hexamita inflata]